MTDQNPLIAEILHLRSLLSRYVRHMHECNGDDFMAGALDVYSRHLTAKDLEEIYEYARADEERDPRRETYHVDSLQSRSAVGHAMERAVKSAAWAKNG